MYQYTYKINFLTHKIFIKLINSFFHLMIWACVFMCVCLCASVCVCMSGFGSDLSFGITVYNHLL